MVNFMYSVHVVSKDQHLVLQSTEYREKILEKYWYMVFECGIVIFS